MRRKRLLFLLLVASVTALIFPSYTFGQSSAAALKPFDGLKGKEREQKLSDGAKREGRVVVYSFTAVDQLKPLLDEFQKRYPFIKPEHYRANATGVFNKFATEARAGQTLADVIDISAGETHTLMQMGLIDSYLSPSREGIPRDFLDEKGFWTAHYHFVLALGFNTQHIKPAEAPKSYEELLNPKWKDVFLSTRRIRICSARCCSIGGKTRPSTILGTSPSSIPEWFRDTRSKSILSARERFRWRLGSTATGRCS